MDEQPDPADQDTLVFTSNESNEEPFNTAIDNTSDDSTIIMGKPVTTAFISHQVCIPTEKVGCLQVTSQLQEFFNYFPPKSVEKAFEQIDQILAHFLKKVISYKNVTLFFFFDIWCCIFFLTYNISSYYTQF